MQQDGKKQTTQHQVR